MARRISTISMETWATRTPAVLGWLTTGYTTVEWLGGFKKKAWMIMILGNWLCIALSSFIDLGWIYVAIAASLLKTPLIANECCLYASCYGSCSSCQFLPSCVGYLCWALPALQVCFTPIVFAPERYLQVNQGTNCGIDNYNDQHQVQCSPALQPAETPQKMANGFRSHIPQFTCWWSQIGGMIRSEPTINEHQ